MSHGQSSSSKDPLVDPDLEVVGEYAVLENSSDDSNEPASVKQELGDTSVAAEEEEDDDDPWGDDAAEAAAAKAHTATEAAWYAAQDQLSPLSDADDEGKTTTKLKNAGKRKAGLIRALKASPDPADKLRLKELRWERAGKL